MFSQRNDNKKINTVGFKMGIIGSDGFEVHISHTVMYVFVIYENIQVIELLLCCTCLDRQA